MPLFDKIIEALVGNSLGAVPNWVVVVAVLIWISVWWWRRPVLDLIYDGQGATHDETGDRDLFRVRVRNLSYLPTRRVVVTMTKIEALKAEYLPAPLHYMGDSSPDGADSKRGRDLGGREDAFATVTWRPMGAGMVMLPFAGFEKSLPNPLGPTSWVVHLSARGEAFPWRTHPRLRRFRIYHDNDRLQFEEIMPDVR